MRSTGMRSTGLLFVFLLLLPPTALSAALSGEIAGALEKSPYVYLASSRKDGSFGRAAEIWFHFHQGAVYVSSPGETWRVRRIRAGRPSARIAVGQPDGPSFLATGEIVADPAVNALLLKAFAKKYPDRWPAWGERFKKHLADGSRVVVRYTPK